MTIADATFSVLDTETTGADPDDPRTKPCEVAVVLVAGDGAAYDHFQSLIAIEGGMPPGPRGIHHISDEDLAGAPTREEVSQKLASFVPPGSVMVAHHSDYDRKVMADEANGLGQQPWLCTYRMAQHLVKDAPDYHLQTLRYFLGVEQRIPGVPHRAMYDTITCAYVLGKLLERYYAFAEKVCAGDEARLEKAHSLDGLLAFVARPITMERWPNFGKHKGELLAKIPPDYLSWYAGEADPAKDADLLWNVKRELKRRSGAA